MKPLSLEALQEAITDTAPRSRTRLVAIDGFGGAGKSELAQALNDQIDEAAVVEVDDFWHPSTTRPQRDRVVVDPGCDYDWRRLLDQVITPLREDRPAWYQRYDWGEDELLDWVEVTPGGTVIVEGVFSTRPELRSAYDCTVWVDCPIELCLKRGYERDGENGFDLWENEWIPAYRRYVELHDPRSHIDYVFDGIRG